MLQDVAALAPSAIVCVGFIFGAWMLLRRELGPKRRRRAEADGLMPAEGQHEGGKPSES